MKIQANNKSLKNVIGSIAAGVILTTLGLLLTFAIPGKQSKAATSATYGETWQAKNALAVSIPYGGGRNNIFPIGVSRWQVTGSSNNQYFKETWDTEALNFDLNHIPSGTDWLAGFVANTSYGFTNPATASLSFISRSDFNSSTAFTPSGSQVIRGTAAACNSEDCAYASGTYGFEYWHKFDTSSDGKQIVSGMLMPLKWTIKGYICDNNTIGDCVP